MIMAKPNPISLPIAPIGGLIAILLIALLSVTSPAWAGDKGPPRDLLISDIVLIDFAGDEVRRREGQSVLIHEGRIVAVEPSDRLSVPPAAERIEGQGRTLVPGLTDMHVHIWDEAELGAYLASGVTTVRNMSGMPFLLEMRDRIASGELAGPTIVTTGPILNSPGPNAQLNHQIVETAEEGRAAVRGQFEQGYRRIKVYSNLRRAAYEGIKKEAKSLGLTLTGHTPEGARVEGIPEREPFAIAFTELLDDGFATIEHVESIVWHGLRNRHDKAEGRALARRIAEAGVAVDPTLIAFANLARVAETQGAHLAREGTETLNPFVRSMESAQSERWSSEDATRARDQLAFYIDFTKMLAEEGVTLVTGSDAGIATNIPGVSLHDEFDLLIDAGLTPAQVLRSATADAAHVMGLESEFATIDPGLRADLLLIDGDPMTEIELLRRPSLVIANGVILNSERIETLRRSASLTDADRTAANVLAAMAAQGTTVDLGD